MITRRNSTKSERIFYEFLKELRIPFKYKIKISDREVDFLIGNYAIEIDGHQQDVEKNQLLASKGFTPVHFNNNEIKNTKQWLVQTFLPLKQLP